MRKLTLIPVILIFLFSSIAFAQLRNPALVRQRSILRQNSTQIFSERIISNRLNLTEEQKDKLKELRENSKKEREGIVKDLREAEKELGELMKEKNPNEMDVNRKVEQINSIKSALFKKEVEMNLERRKIFTDEQWEKSQDAKKFLGRGRLLLRGRQPMILRNRGQFSFSRDLLPRMRFFNRGFDIRNRFRENRVPLLRERFRSFFNRPEFRQQPRLERRTVPRLERRTIPRPQERTAPRIERRTVPRRPEGRQYQRGFGNLVNPEDGIFESFYGFYNIPDIFDDQFILYEDDIPIGEMEEW